jgi:hypothetical protein
MGSMLAFIVFVDELLTDDACSPLFLSIFWN